MTSLRSPHFEPGVLIAGVGAAPQVHVAKVLALVLGAVLISWVVRRVPPRARRKFELASSRFLVFGNLVLAGLAWAFAAPHLRTASTGFFALLALVGGLQWYRLARHDEGPDD